MATTDQNRKTTVPNTAQQWLNAQRHQARGAERWAILFGVLNGWLIIAQMTLIAFWVHALVIARQPWQDWQLILWALLGVLAFRAATQALQEVQGHHASSRIRGAVRTHLMRRWEQLGPVQLSGSAPASLASQWIEQVEALDGYYSRYLAQQWICILVPLSILILVFILDWFAGLLLLLAAPLIPLFMALVGMGAERLNQQHFALVTRLASHFTDRVRGLTTLRLFGRLQDATRQVSEASEQYRALNMKTLRVAFLSSAVLEFFASVAIAVLAIYIGFGLLGFIDWGPAPKLTLFSGLLILLLAPEYFQPLRTLAQHYHDRAAALGAASHLEPMLQATPAAPKAVPTPPHELPAAISINQVHFQHPKRPPLLNGFNLSIAEGEMVALVGPSGSGKSTVLHLLAGFIQPQRGTVSVLGQPPGSQPIAWMDQRPTLLQGSWLDNCRMVKPDVTPSEAIDAITAAGLGELIASQAMGLETLLQEGGFGLSGGQGRRLALARVFLSAAPLVLLDEPTTGLDDASEAFLIAAFKQLARQGRTLVIATHHPQLIKACDRQVFLNAGGHDAVA